VIFDYKIDQLLLRLGVVEDILLKELLKEVRQISARLAILEAARLKDDQLILSQLSQLLAIFAPRAAYVSLILGGEMPLTVGSTATATVVVLDQFGQPFAFDFTANPPSWTVGDAAQDSLAAGSTQDTETITSLAGGSQTLSVTVPGVANGSASLSFTNVAPAPVATSVQITTSPDITG